MSYVSENKSMDDILSLEQLSFNVIRDNFSRFTYCYDVSDNETLKRNLLFLQRVYTQQLFCELDKNNKLEKKHFDFLLNENLRLLRIDTLMRHLEEEEILEKVIPIAHTLREFSSRYLFTPPLTLLKRLFLHTFNLEKVGVQEICNDELLELIASSCPRLIILAVMVSRVTDEGLKALCSSSDGSIRAKCPIKTLVLRKTQLSKQGVAFLLQNLPTLEEVIYPDLPSVIELLYILNAQNSSFQKIIKYNLLSLDFTDCNSDVTRVLTICAKACPKVKTLTVEIDKAEDLNLIACFSELENLNLRCLNEQDVININDFLTFKGEKLKKLILDWFSLSVIVFVEKCPNLEVLSLQNIEYQNIDKDSVNSLKKLHSLEFMRQNYGSIDRFSMMKLLNSSPNLNELLFSGYEFDKSDIVELLEFSQACNLIYLAFISSNVRRDFFQQFILNCNSLKTLSLEKCESLSYIEYNILEQFIKESTRKVLINYFDGSDYDDYSLSSHDLNSSSDYSD